MNVHARRYHARRCYELLGQSTIKRGYTRPSFAPKVTPNLKHIRENPGLYEQNCIDRNYAAQAQNGWKILELHRRLVRAQHDAVTFRQRSNAIGKELGRAAAGSDGYEQQSTLAALRKEAKQLKSQLSNIEALEKDGVEQMEQLALDLPNLSSLHTPVGEEPEVLGYINDAPRDAGSVSHVVIGKSLDILDFESSATTSGWGWYFLKNEGALLEQALIQYAISIARERGWQVVTPPSLVYGHIAHACGFMPRDQNGETQIYGIATEHGDGTLKDKPSLVLAGTAEIPFAGSKANATLSLEDLPLKYIGPSRSYRAEAGARGVDTKGLYRVHEFTKVEMFAWTRPDTTSSARFGDGEATVSQAQLLFDEMIDTQKTILTNLGLHAKILEMPTADLGASASRKIDIEAYFPSRQAINDGYGEVTSASICTDYQSRRLSTRVKLDANSGGDASGKLSWPYTVNGTAMAVPRVLACIMENGWDATTETLHIPKVLWRWLPDGMEKVVARKGR